MWSHSLAPVKKDSKAKEHIGKVLDQYNVYGGYVDRRYRSSGKPDENTLPTVSLPRNRRSLTKLRWRRSPPRQTLEKRNCDCRYAERDCKSRPGCWSLNALPMLLLKSNRWCEQCAASRPMQKVTAWNYWLPVKQKNEVAGKKQNRKNWIVCKGKCRTDFAYGNAEAENPGHW